jgi:uncharacterized protein
MPRHEDDDEDRDQEGDEEEYEDDPPRKSKRGGPTQEDKQMAMFCHLGGLIGGIIIPLILWLIYKDKSKFIDEHGKEALNFDITVLIIVLVTCCLGSVIMGPLAIVFHVLAAMAASRGESYRYPMTIRFIK